MSEQTQKQISADEFFQLPETNLPVQLLDGWVVRQNTPDLIHQDIVGNIAIFFYQKAKERDGKAYVAPVDVYFDELNISQPDVIWLAPNTQCETIGTHRLSGAPDLIAEVLLPGTAHVDCKGKYRLYEKHSVREYWMVDPRDELVEVWQHQEGRFVLLDVFGIGETFISSLLGAVEVALIFNS